MYEDDPQDTVFDVLGDAVFGDHPLGRPIIGRAPVIRDTPVDRIAAFHARRYVPALGRRRGRRLGRPRPDRRAGGADARRPARRRARARARRRAAAPARRACASRPRRPSRSTSASAARARRATTSAATRCACSTRSSAGSRRRACSRACARSAGSPTPSTRSPASSPTPARSASTSARGPDNLAEAMAVVDAELARLREQPASEEELARARENVKARVVLAMESSVGAHEPPRRRDAVRPAAAGGRRGHGEGRRRARWTTCASSSTSCGRPSGCRPPASGRRSDAFCAAVAPVCPAAEPVAA